MPKPGGIFIVFDEERRSDLIQERHEGGVESFSEALSVPDWQINELDLALLLFHDDSFDYLSLVRRSRRVATAKVPVEFSQLINLNRVALKSLQNLMTPSLEQHFIRSSRGIGRRVPPETWAATLRALKELRPSLKSEIERLEALVQSSRRTLRGSRADLLVQEREALGTALDIFGGSDLRQRVLQTWAPTLLPETDPSPVIDVSRDEPPFLYGIAERYMDEESALQHDLFNWEGITGIHSGGISHFVQGERDLHVFYANRNGLERTLGVDLIYYNARYRAFVLVQYKLMRSESGEHVYRPDSQFGVEIERMDSYVRSHPDNTELRTHEDLRLSPDGFFVKLVPNKGPQPGSGELVRGMYVGRAYLKYWLSMTVRFGLIRLGCSVE